MKKGERTRERIIRQAAPLFNQRGYDGSSLNEIMAATELEKGGIYRHFASKQELAAAAFDYAWAEAMKARRHDIDSVAHSVDKLKRYIANFVERRGTVPGGCPLLNTAMDSDDGNALLRNRARRALAELAEFSGFDRDPGNQEGRDSAGSFQNQAGESDHRHARRRGDDRPPGTESPRLARCADAPEQLFGNKSTRDELTLYPLSVSTDTSGVSPTGI